MKQEAEIDAAKRREAAEMERKRRADMDNAWEESREERVSGAYIILTGRLALFPKGNQAEEKGTECAWLMLPVLTIDLRQACECFFVVWHI